MKNHVIFFLLPLIFSCNGNLKKDKETEVKKQNSIETEGRNVGTDSKTKVEKQNSIETEVTLVMQEYGYNGLGTYISPTGEKYIGEWKNGKYHGLGTCFYPNRSIYKGEWRNGNWNGQGTYTKGTTTHVGGFKDGKAHGKGIQTEMTEMGEKISKGTWDGGFWTIRE